jgi:hypothetical protein
VNDPNTWTTEDGQKIPIKGMEDRHLLNCLAMLRRKGSVSLSTYRLYLNAPGPNPDTEAFRVFCMEQDQVMNSPVSFHLDTLELEATKRGWKMPGDLPNTEGFTFTGMLRDGTVKECRIERIQADIGGWFTVADGLYEFLIGWKPL